MTGQIAILSSGLMRLATEIEHLSGLVPHFHWHGTGGASAVGGWGHKPTARRARAAARRDNLPYLAFEDGFLRSLRPGPRQKPMSMVIDRSGIYYDARQPSDLETLLQTGTFSAGELSSAAAILSAIAHEGLSKYNHGRDDADAFARNDDRPLVLLIDQTAGDESVAGGLADTATFEHMVAAAVAENPDARIVAKLHPETIAGTKPGCIAAAVRRHGIETFTRHLSPWALLRHGPKVYTVSSQFGFEALLAGCAVTCFGMPFYAGWGLTDDRMTITRRTARRSRDELAAAVFLHYCRYFDAWRRTPVDAMTAIDQLAFLRRQFLANDRPVIGYGIARWKRRAVAAMCDGPGGAARFAGDFGRAVSGARASGGCVAAWGATAIRMRQTLESQSIPCAAIEDGFLRSVGLGAAFAQPLSLVFDRRGLYYDPSRPSAIEDLLAQADITPRDIERARALRRIIVEQRITKYNTTPSAALPAVPDGRRIVLVPGQVADDAAISMGRVDGLAPGENVNAWLLRRVRARHPDAYVIFKPHPDVEHLGREGALGAADESHADHVARTTPLEPLLAIAGLVETYSSLSGFEALLRGIPVTTHGLPFYAGWGLTEDCAVISRRGRNRSLDELIAVALIHYPHYWDPVSGLACPPEVAIARLIEARNRPAGIGRLAGSLAGRLVIAGKRVRRRILGTR